VTLLDRMIVRTLPAVPRPVVRRISERYIAGTELSDACRVVERLNGRGKMATIDVLGEEVTRPDEARAIACEYEDVFQTIDRQHLDSNVSVKLTALGLKLDYELCRENVEIVVNRAAESGNFVRVDMEDSSCTDDTLRLYRDLRDAGHENLGVVLQSRLRRTVDDVRGLAPLQPNVRLCKGIYIEPPELAFQGHEEIRDNYVAALRALLDAGCYVGVATHDDFLVDRARQVVADHGCGSSDYEFQMLLGVRENVADRLVGDGHRLRVYVPYGRRWYEYSMRRLQENPKIAGYIASDTFGRILSVGRDGSNR